MRYGMLGSTGDGRNTWKQDYGVEVLGLDPDHLSGPA